MATYEIIIRNETGTDKKSPVAGDHTEQSSQPKTTQNTSDLVKGLVAFKKVTPYVKQAIQHQISTVELRTGSAELQQQIEFGYQVASSVIGIGENILVGFAVGNAPGAIIGAVTGVVSEILNVAYKSDTINLKQSEENISLGIMDRRAGGLPATYSKSREGNQ